MNRFESFDEENTRYCQIYKEIKGSERKMRKFGDKGEGKLSKKERLELKKE